MLDPNELWAIHNLDENDVPTTIPVVFDSTSTSTGRVMINGSEWATWTDSTFPPAIVIHDGQDYHLCFMEGDPDVVTCSPVCNDDDPCSEAQGSSWTAQGGTQ